MSQKIEPCPWCGGEGRIGQAFDDDFDVSCEKCVGSAPVGGTALAAIAAWNRLSRIVAAHEGLVGVCQRVLAEPRNAFRLDTETMDQIRAALALADSIEKE